MSHKQGFRVRFRGFDRTEVMAALAKLRNENSQAWREIDRMSAEIERLQTSMAEQLDNERHVQRALVTASKAADEIRERAEEEARAILRAAEERGKTIVQSLRDQAIGIEGQIDTLLARRRDAEATIEAFVKVLCAELEHVRQPDDSADGVLANTG